MIGNDRGKYLREYVKDYVVFDLETTGVSAVKDDIIEISAIKVRDGEVVDTFSTLVNPMRHIPDMASAVNHITDDMVADQPLIHDVIPLFIEFIGDDVLVGHNIHSFDMKFLWRIAGEMYPGLTITNDYLDTLPYSRKKLPQLDHHKLVDIAEHYGLAVGGAHRALFDCEMNQKCFELMSKEDPDSNRGLLGAGDRLCPKCNSPLKKRNGIYGEFFGCTAFPKCRFTMNVK